MSRQPGQGDPNVPWPGTHMQLGGLLLLALCLRLPNLTQSLWFDEVYMSRQLLGSWASTLKVIWVDIHPPFYYLFMYLWNGLFGDSELSMRLPPLICGLLAIPFTFLVGERLLGRAAGMAAAFLLAVSPVHLWYSIEARPYSLLILLVLVSVWLQLRLCAGHGRRRSWLLYLALNLVMVFTHYYLAVYVLLLAVLGWWTGRRHAAPPTARRFLVVGGVSMLCILLYVGSKLWLQTFESGQSYLRPFGLAECYRLLFQWYWTGNGLLAGLDSGGGVPTAWSLGMVAWWACHVLGLCLFVAGWVTIAGARRGAAPAVVYLPGLLFCLLFCLALLPWMGMPDTYIERSTLPALPFFFLVIGAGLTGSCRAWARRSAMVLVGACCLLNLWTFFAYQDRWTVYKPHPDWRAAASYLGGEIDAGGAGRPLFTSTPNPRSLSYYEPRIQHFQNLASSGRELDAAVAAVRRIAGWLEELARSAAADLEAQKQQLRAGTRIWCYGTGSGSPSATRVEERSSDGIFYVLHNRWHPPAREAGEGDAVQKIVGNPAHELLETRSFASITVYKLRQLR